MASPLKRSLLVALGATLALSGCAVLVPWRLAMGEWRDGLPHDRLVFRPVSDQVATQAASMTLVGLRERAFGLKDVRVFPASSASVLMLASLPFAPPRLPEVEDAARYYEGAVLPVFLEIRWTRGLLLRFEPRARIVRSPFKATWSQIYDATGSADAGPAFLAQRASDLRSAEDARQMDLALAQLQLRLEEAVAQDLPWILAEVTR